MSWQRLKHSDNIKQYITTAIIWMVVVVAYTYLIYKLWTTDWSGINSIKCWWWLLPCIALAPVNVWLEATKWRYLLRQTTPMSMREAQRQVYYGFVGAFITPYRAGDYPARVMLMENKEHWKNAIIQGIYGSAVLTAVIVLAGIVPFCAYTFLDVTPQPWMWLPALIAMCLPRLAAVSGLSLARYIIFCIQLYLMLCLVGVELSPIEALSRIPYYYLLVTITPSIPISDPAIRGSWAAIAFGPLGVVAALGLWVVNTVLPLAIGGMVALQRVSVDQTNDQIV